MTGTEDEVFHQGMHFRSAGAVTIIVGVLSSAALAQPAKLELSFSSTPVGPPPAEFEPMMTGEGPQGRWEIVSDEGKSVLAQTSSEPARPSFPMLVHGTEYPADVAVSVGFKPVSGQIDQAGGVVVRLLDQDNYYVARANSLENNVRFYRVVNGSREQLAGADIPVPANEWHTLGLRAQGNQFSVVFDGKELFAASDDTFGEGGRVGFWTKADSVTYFDRLSIEPLQP
jgi:hypothetical protein